MNHSRFLLPVAGVFCLASLCSVSARAQDLRSMRQSFQTSGQLTWGNQKQSVQRVRVELDEDGDARLKFDGQTRADNWGWREGDWNNWDANQEIDGVWVRDMRGITIDLRHGFGDQTVVGTARIPLPNQDNFDRNRPREIVISGVVARRPWETVELNGRLTLGPNGGPPNGNPGPFPPAENNRIEEFSTIKRGYGKFSDDDLTRDISRVDVQLNRDGKARIIFSGDRYYVFTTRWQQLDADRIQLRIDTFAIQTDRRPQENTRPDANAIWVGGGEIRLDGTRLVSINLSGMHGIREFDLQFEPEDDNGNGGNGPWNGDPNDNGGPWNGAPNDDDDWDGGNNGPWNGDDGGWNGGGNGPWNGGNGGRPGGWNGNGGNRPGGWNNTGEGPWNNGNGGWNGNGGKPPRPVPPPAPKPDLTNAWRGWTGAGVTTKGTLPAPPPLGITQDKPRPQDKPRSAWHVPIPAQNTPTNVTPPAQAPASAPNPAPEQPQNRPSEQPKSQPAEPPKQERQEERPANNDRPKKEEKPREEKPKAEEKPKDNDNSDSQEKPRTRVGRTRS